VHTHLAAEPLSRDDLTDLSVLRLDLIAAIEVLADGLPGRVDVGHLVARNPEGQQWQISSYRSPHDVELDPSWLVPAIEAELERSLADVGGRERTILVGVATGRADAAEESIDEARELARTAGLEVVDTVIQRRPRIDPRFVIGRGKLADLIIRSKQLGASLIVFDRSLTASQMRNVAELTDQKIVDRSQLILDIFAQHAHTREGKIQVELAQLKYLLPRLSGRGTAMSRLAGGIGARGPGETKLETDRRRIRRRVALLEAQLEALTRGRSERRKRRQRDGLPIVSIVGYTNAGKSTLLNRLTGSRTVVEDKLFATLDPASRRLRVPRERDLIVTDTVGFIRDLPPDLLDAFRATLEELADADLLLHVVDSTSPVFDDHIAAVERVLVDLALDDVDRLLVFNKLDAVERGPGERIARERGGIAISARDGTGIVELVERVRARLGVIGRDGRRSLVASTSAVSGGRR